MKWPKYLEPYPLETIAQFVGVKRGTVANWKRKGNIPKGRVQAVRELKKRVKIAGVRRRKATLRGTDTGVLVALLDMAGTPATRKQIEKWKRSGDIPLRYRTFLVDAHSEREPAKPSKSQEKTRFPRSVRRLESSRFIRFVATWDVNEKLTDELLVRIVSLVSSEKIKGDDKKQFRMQGTVELVMVDSDILEYKTGIIRSGDEETEVDAFSEQWRSYPKAVRSLARKLGDYIGDGFFIDSISLFITRRK